MLSISGFQARNEREPMTRKDYEIIAKAFKRHLDTMGRDAFKGETMDENLRRLILSMGIDLEEENERFNLGTFWKACGLTK
jgi:hypothetical protein